MLKWVILVLLIAGGAWVYFNVDFNQLGADAENAKK